MQRPAEGLLVVQKYVFYFFFTLRFPCMSDKTPKVAIFLWEFTSWICVFLPLHMTICITKTVYDRFSIDDITTLTAVGVEGAWFFFSFLCMVHYKRRAKDLIDLMDEIEASFKWRSPAGRTYIDIEQVYKYAKFVSLIWQCGPTCIVIVSIVAPLFDHPMDLPVPTWYPVNRDNTCQFLLAFVLQGWAKMIMVTSFSSGSSFYIAFCLLCCGQFNILRCGLKNLIYTSGVYHRSNLKYQLMTYVTENPVNRFPETINNSIEQAEYTGEYVLAHEIEDSPLPALKTSLQAYQMNNRHLGPEECSSFQDAIKTCVQHHIAIIKACTMMEDFLNYFVFLRVAEMTLQICFLAFMYAKTSAMIPLIFMLLTFVDLFLLTYPGERIQVQSYEIVSSLMFGPWHLVSKHFRNDFNIIMAYSMRPISFTAGKIMKLSTDRFRNVTTTAFSYYTLLSSFDTK